MVDFVSAADCVIVDDDSLYNQSEGAQGLHVCDGGRDGDILSGFVSDSVFFQGGFFLVEWIQNRPQGEFHQQRQRHHDGKQQDGLR